MLILLEVYIDSKVFQVSGCSFLKYNFRSTSSLFTTIHHLGLVHLKIHLDKQIILCNLLLVIIHTLVQWCMTTHLSEYSHLYNSHVIVILSLQGRITLCNIDGHTTVLQNLSFTMQVSSYSIECQSTPPFQPSYFFSKCHNTTYTV